MQPIADKAEIAIDFPDKFYMGGFGRDCAFEARAEDDGVLIRLVRSGGEKHEVHRSPLVTAARRLAAALDVPDASSPSP